MKPRTRMSGPASALGRRALLPVRRPSRRPAAATTPALSITALLALLLAVALTACSDSEPRTVTQHPDEAHRVTTQYSDALSVDLSAMEYRRHSGLFVEDVRVGEGARADSGDIVTVHYTGWLPSGRQFDSTRDSGQPFEVAIGYGRVIDGWEQGIVGMRVGGRRRLVIPPALGYGASGSGPIPGNSTLVFDVELLDVENRVPEGGADADSAAGTDASGASTTPDGSDAAGAGGG